MPCMNQPAGDVIIAALPISASIWLAVGLVLVGLALIVTPLVMRRRAAQKLQSRPAPLTLDQRVQRAREIGQERERLETLLAEAREAITLGLSQLDQRIATLQQLVAEADERANAVPTPAALADMHVQTRRVQVAAPPTQPPEVRDPFTSEVYALADTGKSTLDIASLLGEQAGKIDLMLALRRTAG